MSDEKINVANPVEANTTTFDIIPMSAPNLKLEAPARAGYHRHWFRGNPDRIQKAFQAGYRFVEQGEVKLNNFDLGGDAKSDGNTDMGTRVSKISGEGLDNTGQPERLYLMECKQEHYEMSKAMLADTNGRIADALTAGSIGVGQSGETSSDLRNRKVDTVPSFFKRKS